MKAVQFSIRRPVTITMLFVAISVFGIVSYKQLALDLLPEISYPTLTIRTRYPGAAPHEVESLISRPLENAVSVVNNVVRVSSISRPEVSDVIIEFSWRTQMDFAGLDVREKLDLVQLPQGVERPVLLRYDPSTDPIMRISATGATDLSSVRYHSEEFVRPDLESVAGVAAVRVTGGFEDEIQVELDENRLSSLGISIQEATARLAQENINLTGGTLSEGESRYLVRTLNEFASVDAINDVVLSFRNGAPVRLADVGRAWSGFRERQIITRLNGQESVEIAVFKAADANTVAAASEVRSRLNQIEAEYSGKREALQFEVVFDQSHFIEQSISEVLNTAIYGGILAVLVLFLFLRSFKSTLIIALSIPISIVATFFLMYFFRVSLNIMSLSGLALGIGMLVDNSIVVLESIHRYWKQGHPVRVAADKGAGEVGQAVVASTLTTICVFLPIVFVEGIAGQLFADQALTVTFSLLASLGVAILLIPMLSSLGEGEKKSQPTDLQEVRFFLVGPYRRLLRRALQWRWSSLGFASALLLVSIFALSRLGAELIPEISQAQFLVDLEYPPGTPLEETARRMELAETQLAGIIPVSSYYSTIGVGNQSGVSALEEKENIAQLLVRLQPDFLHEKEVVVIDEVRGRIQAIPNVNYRFSRPTLFSFKAPVEIIVQGYNLTALAMHAERIRERLESVPGLRDVRASTEGGNPEVHLVFDRRRLANFGLTVNQAASLVRNKVLGEIPTELNEGDRKIDIRVRVSEEDRRSVDRLRDLTISSSTGTALRLATVADIRQEEGPAEIRRIGPQRAAVISANLVGRDLRSVVADIEAAVADVPLPSDFAAYVGGQSEERAVAFASMQFAMLLALFLVYLVMASQFESLLQPFILMFAIPFAVIGVAIGLFLTGLPVSIVVLIGAIVLAGIVVNNSIVMIDFTNRLSRQGMDKFEAIMEAASIRLRPILMTTVTTVLALLPMALSWGEGAELRVPLAVTVIGGLLTSTALTLILVPVLYTLVTRGKRA